MYCPRVSSYFDPLLLLIGQFSSNPGEIEFLKFIELPFALYFVFFPELKIRS